MFLDRVWPRLQSANEKPHWISLDFSHWEYQKEESEDESGDEDGRKSKEEAMKVQWKGAMGWFFISFSLSG